MKFFVIRGIVPPGRVHLHKYGLVELYSINDEFAEVLWKQKCPFIHLSDEGRIKFMNQKPIQLHVIRGKKQ